MSNVNVDDMMNSELKKYLDCFIEYTTSGKINALIFNINTSLFEDVYKSKEFDDLISKNKEIFSIKYENTVQNQIRFNIKNETSQFEVTNEYDACSIIKNWWYFKNFNLFSNTHITKQIFLEWTASNYAKNRKHLQEIIDSIPNINLDYVTFMY